MYILLTGHSPFSSKEVRQILKLNVHCNITYKLKDWGCISP